MASGVCRENQGHPEEGPGKAAEESRLRAETGADKAATDAESAVAAEEGVSEVT